MQDHSSSLLQRFFTAFPDSAKEYSYNKKTDFPDILEKSAFNSKLLLRFPDQEIKSMPQ